MDMENLHSKVRPHNLLLRIKTFMADLVEKPVIWFRETVVVPNRKEYYWYHKRYRRVPTVDECYVDDLPCIFEAETQMKRDRLVESNILTILRRRFDECVIYNTPDSADVCDPLKRDWVKAQTNFFIKYGDIMYPGFVQDVYMKQKHRMIWERRHGPVGGESKNQEKNWSHKCDYI